MNQTMERRNSEGHPLLSCEDIFQYEDWKTDDLYK